jgi:adenylate cyclase
MNEPSQSRKLAAILAADVSGYSRLMGDDEKATVQTLTEYRQVFKEHIACHQGRLVDTAGDSVLASFESPVEAVECAVEIQRELTRRNRNLAAHRQMNFRIGINLGDVIAREDGTVYGDGVNIAARLESLAEPGGITVSGTVFDHVESKLPVSFEFAGEQSVKNIAKPVRAYHVGACTSGIASVAPATSPKTWNPGRRAWMIVAGLAIVVSVAVGGWQTTRVRQGASPKGDPVIAVLAFANMSGDPKQEYFSDGLTENIIDSLAQVRQLKVIARNSSFRYKGQTVDARKVGEELGAQYLIEGSVRRSQDTLRVTAQLIDTGSGSHLWSKTYDRQLTAKNVFGIQDEIASGIVNTLAGESGVLRQVGLAVAKRKPPSELSSYECALLGMEYTHNLGRENHQRLRDCLERSVKVDPDYAALWRYLALVYEQEYTFGYDPRPGSLDRALEAAQRAVKLAPDETVNRVILAREHFFRGELAEFKVETDHAIKSSPKGSTSFGGLGLFLCYAGEWEKGLALMEQAKALDPYFPVWYHNGAFHDHYRKGEYAAALDFALKANISTFAQSQSHVVAAYGQLGRPEEAKPYVKRIREIDPSFEVKARELWHLRFQFQPEYLEHLLEGLRKGGLKVPEKG